MLACHVLRWGICAYRASSQEDQASAGSTFSPYNVCMGWLEGFSTDWLVAPHVLNLGCPSPPPPPATSSSGTDARDTWQSGRAFCPAGHGTSVQWTVFLHWGASDNPPLPREGTKPNTIPSTLLNLPYMDPQNVYGNSNTTDKRKRKRVQLILIIYFINPLYLLLFQNVTHF